MIKIEKLNKTYDRRSKNRNKVLHDISLTLPDTGFVCIVGASGCGKTSLLNAVGGLDSFDNGTVTAGETTVTRSGTQKMEEERNRSFGYIFQNYYLLSEHSVGYNVYLGLHSSPLSHREKLSRVKEALCEVDMERYINRAVGELSGGQQQRVAIARALARRPRVIFADEPTGNLDEANTVNICTLLRKISRHSLVVMVTHEDRIARFFADRIITLSDGRVKSDSEVKERQDYAENGGNTIYAGDLIEEKSTPAENVTLRVLREEDSLPVDLTLVIQNDKIIIKLDSDKTVSCLRSEELPFIVEGARPKLSIEDMDAGAHEERFKKAEKPEGKQKKAKCSLGFKTLLAEANNIIATAKKKNMGRSFFLMALTALTIFCVSDYITISNVDPEDFIRSDSHILTVTVERDKDLPLGDGIGQSELNRAAEKYRNELGEKFSDIMFVPTVPREVYYSADIFPQYQSLRIDFKANSFVPLEFLDSSTLISGRMPQGLNEVVVDRWVLDAILKQRGIIQNSITDRDYFLGKTLQFLKVKYAPTIVGICDSGQPSIYVARNAFVSFSTSENEVISLSDLKSELPGRYDDLTLEEGKCAAVYGNATGALAKLGGYFYTTNAKRLDITDIISNEGLTAKYVVTDAQMEELYQNCLNASSTINLYTKDKEKIKEFISAGVPEEYKGKINVTVVDSFGEQYNQYLEAATVRMDARSIILVSMLVLSAMMLYLLSRSHVVERMGMVAVYRLLGIPRQKMISIFALECLLLSLRSSLPAAVLTHTVITVLTALPEVGVSMILPIEASAVVYLAITLFHLIVTSLPLIRLLLLPPARLATKYDF